MTLETVSGASVAEGPHHSRKMSQNREVCSQQLAFAVRHIAAAAAAGRGQWVELSAASDA